METIVVDALTLRALKLREGDVIHCDSGFFEVKTVKEPEYDWQAGRAEGQRLEAALLCSRQKLAAAEAKLAEAKAALAKEAQHRLTGAAQPERADLINLSATIDLEVVGRIRPDFRDTMPLRVRGNSQGT